LLVNKLEPEPARPTKPTRGKAVYDEAFYKTLFNNKSVEEFLKYCRELERLVSRKKWRLEPKFNKYYCGFRAGFFNAFGIKWMGTKTFAFFLKLSESEAKRFRIPMTRYEKLWKEAVYFIEPGKTKVTDFASLFEAAYKKISGK
jgi:hypothetical protein